MLKQRHVSRVQLMESSRGSFLKVGGSLGPQVKVLQDSSHTCNIGLGRIPHYRRDGEDVL